MKRGRVLITFSLDAESAQIVSALAEEFDGNRSLALRKLLREVDREVGKEGTKHEKIEVKDD